MIEFKTGDKAYYVYRASDNSRVIPCTIIVWEAEEAYYAKVCMRFFGSSSEAVYWQPKSALFHTESEAYEMLIEHLENVQHKRVEAFRKKCMKMDAKIAGLRKELENIKQSY